MTTTEAIATQRRIARNALPHLADIVGGIGSGVTIMAERGLDDSEAYRLLALLSDRLDMIGPEAEREGECGPASIAVMAVVMAMNAARIGLACTPDEVGALADAADERADIIDYAKRRDVMGIPMPSGLMSALTQ